ncbi:phage tail tape measure protein [Sphingobium yanoikuyae]|uniref:Phage tail tape measure protein n=1 Tax=Sphingobium yanoikuyae TaxID=13690 RepID=A0A6M4G1C8_SPHYA|nr:phage tail tape measure protein [Sphingobium yanoikuyae]QJR00879.1 phage tail tape measure protein [Sphingobium yanoikuyae]
MASSVIGQLRVILGMDTAAFEKGLTDAERQMARANRNLERMGQRMENVGKSISVAVTLPLLAVGGAALGMVAKFESAMNRVEAATGATGKQLDALKQRAIDLGKDKSFTASAAETADVMEMLAKNGLNVQQILGGATEATLRLAAANGAEFAPAADAVTDIIQQFGRQVSDADSIVNKMTGAMLVSKMGFEDYRLAIGQAGGVAGGIGVQFEDMNVALAATSSLFASGSDAGTSFKTFLTSLPGNSKQAKEAIEAYGLSFYDAQGNMKSLGDIAQNLQDRLGGLNDQVKSEVLSDIFGTDAMRTAIGLMNQGADGIAKVRAEIDKASAQTQMEARMKGWAGAVTQVKKAFEAAAIAMGDSGILGAITKVLTLVASTVAAFASLPQPVQLVIGTILGLTAAVGPLVIITGKAIQMWTGLAVLLVGRFVPAATAATAATVASGTAATGAAVGFTTLRAAMAFLMPWAAVIGGIALALYGMSKATAEAATQADGLANSQSAANKFQAEYQAIMAKDNSAGIASGVNGLADAHKRAADEAFRHAQAELAVRKAAIIQTARDARAGYRTETRTRYETVPGSRERRAVQYNERVALSTRRGGRGGDNSGRSEQDRAMDAARSDWRAVYQQEQDLIAAHKQVLASPAAKPVVVTPTVAANDNGSGGGRGRGKSGPTKEELADRREAMRLDAEMAAAQLRGDEATVQRLQDQIDLKRQIKDYEDAGLTAVEAKKAAEADLATIAAARRVAAQREIADQRQSVELDMARLAGDDERSLQLERELEIKDRILFFERQLVDITDQKLRLEQATAMAMEQQAKVDAARAAGRARWLAQDEAQRQIDVMKARGDTEEQIRQAQRRYDIERRIEQLKAQGFTEGAAREKATAEDSEMEMARRQGEWRGVINGAVRAAMDGDLKGFAKNWWKEQVAKGMEAGLNSISDFLFSLFKDAFGAGASSLGGGGGGGGLIGSIAKGIGSILGGASSKTPSAGPVINQSAISNAFAGLPGFANGTNGWMKPVGGMSGVDKNVVAFRMSSNEEFAVRHQGEDGGPVGGISISQSLTFSGAIDLATKAEAARFAEGARQAAIKGVMEANRRRA